MKKVVGGKGNEGQVPLAKDFECSRDSGHFSRLCLEREGIFFGK